MTRGIWQVEKANATVEEAAAIIQELNSRNIFHSQQTIREKERAVVVREEEEAAEQKRKVLSGVMWGGMGLGMVVLMIYALR